MVKNILIDHFEPFWTPLDHFGMLTSLTCLAFFVCFIGALFLGHTVYVSCFDIFLDPIRFGDVGQKSPGQKFPQNNHQRKFTEDLLGFGIGRGQTTALVEGYLVWRCSILLHPSCVHIHAYTGSV